jgi:hypothetical protein
MFPVEGEEVANSLTKEGISFIFESRSLSAVTRFIYTPIEGTFADLELEINNADPIQPAAQGGISVEMGGRSCPADSDEIERHLVSCEQIGNSIEARWQWKRGDELADFLYRLTLQGKTLIVELDGGHGKATGVDLGAVSGALHPRFICIPYFNLGDGSPHILSTSGVFVSSLLDWNVSKASSLSAPDTSTACRQLQINGGCSYLPKSDGKRNPLHERWLLTVSRRYEEVLPALPAAANRHGEGLSKLIWYSIPDIPPGEEGYVEIYERLRSFKQWGLEELLVIHPDATWHDGDGNATLTLTAAAAKGGDDALKEYLEAIADLGFPCALHLSYRGISPANPAWQAEMAALGPDGKPAFAGKGIYLLDPAQAVFLSAAHASAVAGKFGNPVAYIGAHASLPPWAFANFDSRSEGAGSFHAVYQAQRRILQAQVSGQPGLVIGEGGSHWLYPGLLHGFLARQAGDLPARLPLLVDFDLRYLHPMEIDAGVGTPEQFFGVQIPPGEKQSRSAFFDRYLAAVVAFGHAGLLPDPVEWGLPAVVKTYYLLRQLQRHYLGVPVVSIHYHHEGNLLETSEALIAGAYEDGQVQIVYQSGLHLWVNGSWDKSWKIECQAGTYTLPPGSFLACGPEDLLVYSADAGQGRVDFSRCSDYLYCDTRGNRIKIGPITLDGAALVLQQKWAIDVLPLECSGEVEINLADFWPDRRLPPLRLLAFKPDEESPDNLKANMAGQIISFQPLAEYFRYRITLPEWMVEPGR